MTEPTVTLDNQEPLKGSARVATPKGTKPRASISEAKRKGPKRKARKVYTEDEVFDAMQTGFSKMPELAAADLTKRGRVFLDKIREIDPNASMPGNVWMMWGRLSGNIGDKPGDSADGAGTIHRNGETYRTPAVQVIYPHNKKYETQGRILALVPYSFGTPAHVLMKVLAAVCELVCFDTSKGVVDMKRLTTLQEKLGFLGKEVPGSEGKRKAPTASSYDPQPKLVRLIVEHLNDHGPLIQQPINLKKDTRTRTERGSSRYDWKCQVPGCPGGFSMTKEQHGARFDVDPKTGECAMKLSVCGHNGRMLMLVKEPNTPKGQVPKQPKVSMIKLGLAKDAKTGKVKKGQVSEEDAQATARETAKV